MRKKEDLFKKNHMLGVEFDRYLLENPELLDQIPENEEVYSLPEENPELSQENLKAAQAQEAKRGKVVLVRIGKLFTPHLPSKNLSKFPISDKISKCVSGMNNGDISA